MCRQNLKINQKLKKNGQIKMVQPARAWHVRAGTSPNKEWVGPMGWVGQGSNHLSWDQLEPLQSHTKLSLDRAHSNP